MAPDAPNNDGYLNFLRFLQTPLPTEDMAAYIEDADEAHPGTLTLMEEGKSATKSATTFVDYVPPPRPPVPPPAKYKLCIVIWFTVYFVMWFAEGAGIAKAFIEGGLNRTGAVWCVFMIEIFVMVFCCMELVIGLVRIKISGTWYGILPWLMQPRWQWVRKSENFFVQILACFVVVAEDGFAIFTPAKVEPPPPKVRVFDLLDKEKQAVLRAQHDVDPNKVDDYNKWARKMIAFMESQPGFIAAEKDGVDKDVHTWTLKFENVTALNNCMAMPPWVMMVGELKDLLKAPKVTQIMMEHPPMNAFVDLFTRQGDPTPILPPKKWKVWWITTCSIFFSWLIANATIFTYYVKWGWDTGDKELYRLAQSGTLVIILNYVVSPATLLLVNDWMIRKPHENDTKIPWKQLNDGLIPPVQLVCAIAYFVTTGIVWSRK